VEPHLEQGNIKVDNWLVSAFVTEGTAYELILATQLLPSLDKLGLKYHIEVVENLGSWLKNVAQKPLTILHTMEKYPSYNIVVLDADSEVLQFPKLFNEISDEYDIALHTLNWNEWYKNGSNVMETLSGTIWIKNNEKMREFVKEWYLLAENSHTWEQRVLASLLEERKDIKIYPLPISYCAIATMPDGKEPLFKIDNIYILHHQASRQNRRRIR